MILYSVEYWKDAEVQVDLELERLKTEFAQTKGQELGQDKQQPFETVCRKQREEAKCNPGFRGTERRW